MSVSLLTGLFEVCKCTFRLLEFNSSLISLDLLTCLGIIIVIIFLYIYNILLTPSRLNIPRHKTRYCCSQFDLIDRSQALSWYYFRFYKSCFRNVPFFWHFFIDYTLNSTQFSYLLAPSVYMSAPWLQVLYMGMFAKLYKQ